MLDTVPQIVVGLAMSFLNYITSESLSQKERLPDG